MFAAALVILGACLEIPIRNVIIRVVAAEIILGKPLVIPLIMETTILTPLFMKLGMFL